MVYAAEPAGTGELKVAVALVVIYVLSPVDLLSETIPLLRVGTDLALVLLAVSFIARRLPAAAGDVVVRRAS